MKTIRVLFPDRLDKPVGGLSIVGSKLKKYLSSSFNFEFIGQPQDIEMENYRSVSFPLNVNHGPINTITGQISYFANCIQGEKPDIIHAFDWSVFLAGVYASSFYNVPLICSIQLSINKLNIAGINYSDDISTVDGYWINETHKQIEIHGLNKADKLIHVSSNYFKGFDLYKDKSVIIQNGVDINEFTGQKITLPGTNPIKVVYIGRFASMKNIEALTQVEIPNGIDLLYIGGPNGGENYIFDLMINHTKFSKNNNVYYIGEKYGKEKIDILNSADAVIFPSLHEPFGIVGLEAMASKSILLTSRIDGISDYANNDNSIYCGTTPDSILLALNYLKKLSTDEKRKLLENGYETARKFNWETSMVKYKSVYESLLN